MAVRAPWTGFQSTLSHEALSLPPRVLRGGAVCMTLAGVPLTLGVWHCGSARVLLARLNVRQFRTFPCHFIQSSYTATSATTKSRYIYRAYHPKRLIRRSERSKLSQPGSSPLFQRPPLIPVLASRGENCPAWSIELIAQAAPRPFLGRARAAALRDRGEKGRQR